MQATLDWGRSVYILKSHERNRTMVSNNLKKLLNTRAGKLKCINFKGKVFVVDLGCNKNNSLGCQFL